MMSKIEEITKFLNALPKKASFLYEIDPIEAQRQYQFDWDRMSRFKLENPFPEVLKLRIEEHNLVNFVVLTGSTGSGKSNASLWLASEMDQDFSMKHNIYLGKDTDLSLDYIVEEHEKGEWIIIEEAQYVVNRYAYRSTQSKEARGTLDSIRDYGVNFIFNAPSINTLDKHIVEHQIDFNIICSYVDHKKKTVDAFIEANCKDTKIYNYGYVDHSQMKIPFIKSNIFEEYQEIKRKKLYDPQAFRRTFKEARSERLRSKKQQKAGSNLIDFQKIVDENQRETREDDIKIAVKGLEMNISKSKIKGILRIGDGKINEAEAKYLIDRERERKKRGKQ